MDSVAPLPEETVQDFVPGVKTLNGQIEVLTGSASPLLPWRRELQVRPLAAICARKSLPDGASGAMDEGKALIMAKDSLPDDDKNSMGRIMFCRLRERSMPEAIINIAAILNDYGNGKLLERKKGKGRRKAVMKELVSISHEARHRFPANGDDTDLRTDQTGRWLI